MFPLVKITLEPLVLPLFPSSKPNTPNNLTNSSQVKSLGRDWNRFMSFSFVPIYKLFAKVTKI